MPFQRKKIEVKENSIVKFKAMSNFYSNVWFLLCI